MHFDPVKLVVALKRFFCNEQHTPDFHGDNPDDWSRVAFVRRRLLRNQVVVLYAQRIRAGNGKQRRLKHTHHDALVGGVSGTKELANGAIEIRVGETESEGTRGYLVHA
jgi:hypothetical protein